MRTLTLCIAVIALASGAFAQEVQLEAGVARVDVTPAGSMPMYGYANRKCGPSNGIHDPLYAKALVLATGNAKIAIVTLDLGSIVSQNLRRELADKLGIPVLLLSASHTHSGPSFLPSSGSVPGITPASMETPPYLAELERKIFGAVKEAAASMFPARLSIGRGSLQLGYNRLLLRDDGRARALFDAPAMRSRTSQPCRKWAT